MSQEYRFVGCKGFFSQEIVERYPLLWDYVKRNKSVENNYNLVSVTDLETDNDFNFSFNEISVFNAILSLMSKHKDRQLKDILEILTSEDYPNNENDSSSVVDYFQSCVQYLKLAMKFEITEMKEFIINSMKNLIEKNNYPVEFYRNNFCVGNFLTEKEMENYKSYVKYLT